jgi:signal transduction histidine kinase/CheY-like chemotaxis protein
MHEEFNPMEIEFELPQIYSDFSERSSQPMVAVEGRACIVRHANAAFLKLSGTARTDLIGNPFDVACPEANTNGCMALLDRVLSSGQPGELTEQVHSTAPPVYWSYAAWPILGGDDLPVGSMLQVTDSTEVAVFREQSVKMNESLLLAGIRQHEMVEGAELLTAQLQAALKEKDYFIAVLSHELRTPLAPVLIGASVLLQDRQQSADSRFIAEMIHRNITLEAHLIDDLLDITRMEHGKLNLDRHNLDLRGIVERSIGMCADEIETNQLTVEVESDKTPQLVFADESRLLQVFTNLLRNAVKFTPAGGNIVIRSRCERDTCTVEVIDDGEGIDPEFLPRIFSAFEQRERPHTRRRGLGLGLAICKTIVGLHNGTISAFSKGKGLGTSFVVVLPGSKSASAPEPVMPLLADQPPVSKSLQILLVEDHADTARMMSRVLKNDGHTVQWAADMADGLRLAATHRFDLLLCDLGLPDGTGWDLMRKLRATGSHLPGIVLSGYGQDQDLQRSREAGFETHLTKPVNIQTLRESIGTFAA